MEKQKRYYWLKLKEDFFRDRKIKKLRKIAGGDTFVIIYLKLQLLSLSKSGFIVFEGLENKFAEEMALELDEDIENVEVTINYLIMNGLLVNSEIPNEYELPQTQKLIGSEGQSAERVRKFREKQKLTLEGGKPDEKETKKDIEAKIDESFEEVWTLYPNKQGKKQVNKKAKKRIYENKEEMIRCVKRYIEHKKSQKNGMDFLLNGSTFFNTRYFDYTDKIYKDTMSHVNNRKNNNNPQDIPDDDSWGGMKLWTGINT